MPNIPENTVITSINATLHCHIDGNTKITLHTIVRNCFLWEATINETGQKIHIWDHEFKVGS